MTSRAPFLVLVGLALPGCSLLRPQVEVIENPVPIVCETARKPDALALAETPPRVVFDTETETWGFWFTADDYASLAENIQALRRYINQSREIRTKLIRCIDEHNERTRRSSSSRES